MAANALPATPNQIERNLLLILHGGGFQCRLDGRPAIEQIRAIFDVACRDARRHADERHANLELKNGRGFDRVRFPSWPSWLSPRHQTQCPSIFEAARTAREMSRLFT